MSGLTGLLDGGDARHLAGEDVGDIGHRRLDQRLVVDGGQGSRDGGLGLRAVRDHDRGVQGLGIVPQHDGERPLLAHRQLFGDVAKGRYLEHRILIGDDERKASVHVGSHTGGRPLQGDARTDYRQSVRVHDITLDGNAPVLGEGPGAP